MRKVIPLDSSIGILLEVVSSHLNFRLAILVNEHSKHVLLDGSLFEKTWDKELCFAVLVWWKSNKTWWHEATQSSLLDNRLEQVVFHASLSYSAVLVHADGVSGVKTVHTTNTIVKSTLFEIKLFEAGRVWWVKSVLVVAIGTVLGSKPHPRASWVKDHIELFSLRTELDFGVNLDVLEVKEHLVDVLHVFWFDFLYYLLANVTNSSSVCVELSGSRLNFNVHFQ